MTHREMVILTPQRGITVNREQMEAHLTLHGWQPMFVGQAAAMNADELVVYCFDTKGPWDSRYHNGVETAKQTLTQLNLKKKSGAPAATPTDCWYMSDKYFWTLAHRCVEVDNQGKT